MGTQTSLVDAKAEKAGDKAKGPREVRSFGVRLTGDKEETLHVRAHKTKAGWRSEVMHQQGKKRTRGASADHATMEQARAAVEALAKAAEKAGWKRRESRDGGFARRPDAFGLSDLPKPGKTKK